MEFETIVIIFRKIIQLIAPIILKNTNGYYQKIMSKSGHKMDLYPAMDFLSFTAKFDRLKTIVETDVMYIP